MVSPRGRARVALVTLTLLALTPATAIASDTPLARPWVANGPVNATEVDDAGRTYIGGEFDMVGPRTGAAIALSATSDQPKPGFPDVVGDVLAVESDGAGGWFVGGNISAVAGVPRSDLAHVLADGSLDAAWAPEPNRPVRALVRSGDRLFVGGEFTTIGGKFRNHVAKLTVGGTGAADASWNPDTSGFVRALALSGTSLFIGGTFSDVGVEARDDLAKVSTTGVGAVDATWAPANGSTAVLALAVSGANLYVGGSFTHLGGQSRNNIAKLSTTGAGAADATWNPDADSDVRALATDGTSVFAGGMFFQMSAAAHPFVAKLPAGGTGAADAAWQPGPDGFVNDLELTSAGLVAAGEFTFVDGFSLERSRLARFATGGSGAADSWNPNANDVAQAIATSGDDLLVGGMFTSAGASNLLQPALARLSPAGAGDAAWRPILAGSVNAILLSDTAVTVGGDFGTFGGPAELARFSTTPASGDLHSDVTWHPDVPGPVHALARSGDDLFVGGDFSGTFGVGGPTRHGLAKVSAVGAGALDATWNPDPQGGPIDALAVVGSSVFVGGNFFGMGATNVENLAKVATTGAGAPDATWDPQASDDVETIVPLGADLLVGGRFLSIGGATRFRAAKIATTGTGAADPDWDPRLNGPVFAMELAPGGGGVYIGGDFTSLFGGGIVARPFSRVARLATGGAGDPDPAFGPAVAGGVRSLAATPSRVVVGGAFRSVAGVTHDGVALFDLTRPSASITVPAEGAHYTVGAAVAAAYSCTDPDPFVDVTCAGPVAAGAPIDTATTGTKSFAVTATDGGANASSQTVSYVVDPVPPVAAPPGGGVAPPGGGVAPPGGGGGPVADVIAPVLSTLGMAPSSFRAARTGGPTARARGSKPKVGGRVSYTLTEAARVTFTVIRDKAGRRKKKTMGRFVMTGAAGVNRFDLRGRVARKTLALGRYTLSARAVDAAGNRSKVVRKGFRITR
ncbi:MAG TPA: hypothetical protein VF549_02255 [Solirubrobacteraceae bacterium]|jgi:hypothetical protein